MNHHHKKTDLDTMIRTIYGEARGEYFLNEGGLASLISVANVIYNRHKKRKITIDEVCKAHKQFSCWNKNDPNFNIIIALSKSNPFYQRLQMISEKVLEEQWPDITNGADHYLSCRLTIKPFWAAQMTKTIRIGNHQFYKSHNLYEKDNLSHREIFMFFSLK
jgi:hypothetical protein